MDLELFPTSASAKRMIGSVSEEFYAKSYVAKWLYQVMGLEWDAVWEIIESIPEQAFVETATWGLMYHEMKWGLPVRENLDYATRRRLIYEKRDVKKPMNPWAMERIIYDMTGRASRVMDSHDNPAIPPNTFVAEIESAETDIDICAVLRKIRELKQSHVAFTFLICSRVTLRFSTPVAPYRFPYRMTGEHPDINTIGGMDDISVDISSGTAGYPFDYPLTGPHLAGSVPDENTIGFLSETELTAHIESRGAAFPYGLTGERSTGTAPEESVAGCISDVSIKNEADSHAKKFPYDIAGESPDVNTDGFVRDAEIRNELSVNALTFPYDAAGMFPDVNTVGALGDVGLRNAPDSHAFPFQYVSTCETDAGTHPDMNTSGAFGDVDIRNNVATFGDIFPYDAAGCDVAGTVPDIVTEGSESDSEIAGMSSGSWTVIDYPLCGEDD